MDPASQESHGADPPARGFRFSGTLPSDGCIGSFDDLFLFELIETIFEKLRGRMALDPFGGNEARHAAKSIGAHFRARPAGYDTDIYDGSGSFDDILQYVFVGKFTHVQPGGICSAGWPMFAKPGEESA